MTLSSEKRARKLELHSDLQRRIRFLVEVGAEVFLPFVKSASSELQNAKSDSDVTRAIDNSERVLALTWSEEDEARLSESRSSSRAWRYQPVYRDVDGVRTFSLVEVHFDDKGALENWSDVAEASSHGTDLGDLRGLLLRMIQDTYLWAPVEKESLRAGQIFETIATKPDLQDLAKLIEELP